MAVPNLSQSTRLHFRGSISVNALRHCTITEHTLIPFLFVFFSLHPSGKVQQKEGSCHISIPDLETNPVQFDPIRPSLFPHSQTLDPLPFPFRLSQHWCKTSFSASLKVYSSFSNRQSDGVSPRTVGVGISCSSIHDPVGLEHSGCFRLYLFRCWFRP